MKRVALTGGIACGKSLLTRYLNELGVETVDADDLVHEILPDPAERRRIAAEVFADPEKRKALEARLHPLVKARIDAFLSSPSPFTFHPSPSNLKSPIFNLQSSIFNFQSPPRLAVIPLLFETHWDADYDIICCVASQRETQVSRMMTTRGYTRAEAEARLAAQMPVAEKAAKSHYVIVNDGSSEDLKIEAKKFVEWLAEQIRPDSEAKS